MYEGETPEPFLKTEWEVLGEDERKKVIGEVQRDFENQIALARTLCIRANKREAHLTSFRNTWKVVLIILSAVIAMINIAATKWLSIAEPLTVVSAIFAVLLTMISNLDGFFDHSRKSREVSDLYRSMRDAIFRFESMHSIFVGSDRYDFKSYSNSIKITSAMVDAIERAQAMSAQQKLSKDADQRL